MPAPTCPNCGLLTSGRYCSDCGQDNIRPRLLARSIFAEGISGLLGWESALGRTTRGLVRSPGGLAADYVSGHRKRYVNPVRFCLLSLALWFLASRAAGLTPLEVSGINITNKSGDSQKLIDDLRAIIGGNLELLLFLALPLRAVLLHMFFRKSGRNLAECLVVVMYLAGFGYLVGMLLTPLQFFGLDWATAVRPGISLLWSFLAAKTFFGRGLWATLWRTLSVGVLHMLGTFVLFGAIAVPWVLLTAEDPAEQSATTPPSHESSIE